MNSLEQKNQELRAALFDHYRSKEEEIGNRSWRGRRCSLYHGIPMSLFEQFRKFNKETPILKILGNYGYNYTRVKYAFRGPRHYGVGDTRNWHQKQSNCLKRFATSFSVYLY